MSKISSVFTLFLILVSCHRHPSNISEKVYRWPVMGSFFEVVWHTDHSNSDKISAEMFEQIRSVDEKVSIYKSQSELSQINLKSGTGEWITIDEITQNLLKESQRIQGLTQGYFNISVGVLVKLWKLHLPLHGEELSLPSQAAIDQAIHIKNTTKIEVENRLARVYPKGALLDMGGIAKGHALDLAFNIYGQENCGHMNLGRQMMVIGNCAKPLRFAIEDPVNSKKISALIDLASGSLSTTGGSERFFIHEQLKYGHIIHPNSGGPVQSKVLSVTVWSKTGTEADAWSTALYVAGFDKGMALIHDLKLDIGVLWIFDDGRIAHQNTTFGKVI